MLRNQPMAIRQIKLRHEGSKGAARRLSENTVNSLVIYLSIFCVPVFAKRDILFTHVFFMDVTQILNASC